MSGVRKELMLAGIDFDDNVMKLEDLNGIIEDVELPKGELGNNITKSYEAGEKVIITVKEAEGGLEAIRFNVFPKG